jgi:hypothetical protein
MTAPKCVTHFTGCPCKEAEAEERGYRRGVKYAVNEVVGWRALILQSYRVCQTTDSRNAARECRNTLNLLDVIIAMLKTKARMPAMTIEEMMAQKKSDGVDYP